MEKREQLIILYDYYGELLSDDNKRYFEDYYFDNLSLAEISENYQISRNAVHKHIKSTHAPLKLTPCYMSIIAQRNWKRN